MFNNAIRLAPALMVLLAACAALPDSEVRPDPGVPAHWGPEDQPASGLPDPLPWQTLYTDVRLQSLIRTALERNHDVRLALARIDEARALWGVQRADQLPNLSLGASHTGSRTPAGVQGNASAVNVRRYDLGLNLLSYELDVWGRVASLTEAARLNFEASEEDRRTVRIGLVGEVANAYYAWLEATQRLALFRLAEKNRAEVLQLIERRNQQGAASRLDVTMAESAVQNARADIQAMQRQTDQARNALTLLIGGQWPGSIPTGLPLALQSLELTWGADLSSEALLRRPDVRASEQRLRAAKANILAARAAFFPRLQLTGLIGTASPALNNLMGGGSQAWNFVPSLQLPIFDAGRNQSGLDLAMARQNQSVVIYERTVQQAFREVADALVARDTLRDQWRILDASLRTLREREQLVSVKHRLGASSLQDWLDAQRDLLQAEQTQVQIHRQWLSASSQLYKALGGGDL